MKWIAVFLLIISAHIRKSRFPFSKNARETEFELKVYSKSEPTFVLVRYYLAEFPEKGNWFLLWREPSTYSIEGNPVIRNYVVSSWSWSISLSESAIIFYDIWSTEF